MTRWTLLHLLEIPEKYRCWWNQSVALLHLDTPNIADYGALSLQSKRDYAERHGMTRIDVHDRIAKDRPASWSKIPLCRDMLENADWVWWLDADTLITTPSVKITDLCDPSYDLVISKDANGINSGSFLLSNSDGARRLLDETWKRVDLIHHPWWEQSAMAAVIAEDPTIRVKYVDQRLLNSYPETWKEGDLLVHFAGKANRGDLMRKFLDTHSQRGKLVSA